jgi:ATP-dependent helicase HrpB
LLILENPVNPVNPFLPVEEALPELRAALTARNVAVLQAPPGAGKTTLVPLRLLDEPWLAGRKILILEPRRLAARAAAARMSALRGEAIGETVGFRIRFDSKVSARTRIEVLTEGILTRRLQNDSALEDTGLVIFDEFHERHLHADLALALTLDSQRALREDLRILVMSATLDGAAVARLLNDAPIVTSEGRSHPVEVRYLPRDPAGPLPETVAQTVLQALNEQDGDVLVFLPGAWEIRRTQELLSARVDPAQVEVMPLYGDLPWEQQDRAILPIPGRRKIVLATPIAETSLTIEGVRVVVDSGFARVPQFDPGSGLSRLVTQRIARANADQRAGRAGRTAPGVCFRLWGETTQRGLIPQPIPEIRAADLAPLALELAAWGVKDAAALSWLDPPPAPALAQARTLLADLDALDDDGVVTGIGRAMARLPLHPRLAHMLRMAESVGLAALACDIAALLSERDVMTGEARRSCDFATRLEVLATFRAHGRQAAQRLGGDPNACARMDQAARQFRRLAGAAEHRGEIDARQVGLLLAFAYPDRVARQRAAGEARYLLAGGRGARLPESEIGLRQPLIVAASLDAGEAEGLIRLAAPVEIEDLRARLPGHFHIVDSVRWDEREQAVLASREERFGALALSAKPLANADPADLRAAAAEGVRRLGIESLPWARELRQWQARVLSMRTWFPEENWPDVSDAALATTIESWLAPHLNDITRREHFARVDLEGALRALLDWKQQQRLDQGAPTHLEVPSGSRIRLDYEAGQPPVLAVKLQEMFGSADTPRVAFGRVPVTLHLLSPAQRPIQVTQDLRGFWERTYAEVKKELKGRYPKHPWPDDPWSAPPTARAKRRSH